MFKRRFVKRARSTGNKPPARAPGETSPRETFREFIATLEKLDRAGGRPRPGNARAGKGER